MKKQETQNSKLVKPKREFGLESSPDAYIISVHVQNMMATFGEEYVRSILKELFLTPAKKRSNKAANE